MPKNGGADASFTDVPASSGTPKSTATPGAAVGGREMVAGSLWVGAIVPLAAFAGAMLVF